MGLLSCFAPLLPARSTAHSTASTTTLVEKDAQHFVEGKPADEDRVVADTGARLAALRRELAKVEVDAYVVPTADAHGSEWVGACDERRAFISGFTGSSGVAVVTKTEAHLFTDSRYYVQAGKQLDSHWTLQKVGEEGVKNWDKWLLELPSGSKIGIDPTLLDYGTGKAVSQAVKARSLSLVFPSSNLVDNTWPSRPPRSAAPIQPHPLEFTGESASSKLASLRKYLRKTFPAGDDDKADPAYLVTTLPAIAWLLNLRGDDIAHNPVFYAYVLVTERECVVWVQGAAVASDEVRRAVDDFGGRIEEYGDALEGLRRERDGKAGKVATDAKASWAVVDLLGEDKVEIVKSPIETAQAVKNQVEIEGFRRAYLRDGAAWARWQAWLEEAVASGKQVTEWSAAEKLTEYRRHQKHFAGLAYENISATGENAALPHYEPSPSPPVPLSLSTPYLNDSGAQYLDGTIDTTRTMWLGRKSPRSEHKRAFTRVLQGHIAVDALVFPEGTTGEQVDVLARAPLWSEGMNYGHGTGHGIGEYLSVHETQVGIAHSAAYFNTPFVPGHITSNEPGYYEVGSYGIRLESVLCVKEARTRRGFGDRRWLAFERLTMVPIDTKLVDFALLSPSEKVWLKRHNQLCREKLLALVKDDKRAVRWLKRQ
ncbi:hypothetical protein JCM9279_007396 [Rhodotorula babjevae]